VGKARSSRGGKRRRVWSSPRGGDGGGSFSVPMVGAALVVAGGVGEVLQCVAPRWRWG
jgi:hypothetical protein